ncbi:MAG: ATP-binding protein [Elusimicrobiota bacterium]
MATRDSQRLELLLEVGRLLSSKLELPDLLSTVLGLASRVMDAETASLLLLDADSQELYFDVALGLGEESAKTRLKLGQGIAGTVAQTRKAEIINEVRRDPRWSPEIDEKSGFATRSILAVPLLLKGRLLGVVEAINKQGGVFDESDREVFEAFASQASVAIDNAQLFASLREEKFKLSTVFSQMHDGAVLSDPSGRVILANDAARRLLGAELANLTGGLADMSVTPPLAELLASEKPSQDFTAVRQEPVMLVMTGRMTRAPLAEREGRLFVFTDATEASRQEHLKRSFLSLISHKLKTPLASVIGFSDILLGELDPKKSPPMLYKAVKTINEQGTKVGELVDKLLHYTIVESPDASLDLHDVRVDEAVAEALNALKEKIFAKKARVDYRPSALTLNVDRALLVEAVKNLVENAFKFDLKPAPAVGIRAVANGGWVALSVSDAGPGIPPEAHERVFSRFHQVEKDFTGQMDGMGLGLAFVKRVCELHGGRVELRSTLGEGTTLTLILPLKRGA